MRILHAVHDYLPQQVGGVEVYTNRLAQRQTQRDHVGVLFAELDPRSRTGALRCGHDGDVETFSLVQNQVWARFERTWRDPAMAPGIGAVLDRFDPDVVHVQHLLNLGTSLVDEARRRGISLVMTLHDHWWACANGGQRFHPDRTRCDVLDPRRCARCTHALVGPALALRGRRRRGSVGRGPTPRGPEAEVDSSRATVGAVSDRLRSAWAEVVGLAGTGRIEGRWRALRALGDRIEAFVAPSRDILEAAVEFGLPRERIVHLRHGLPEHPAAREVSIPDVARRFGYVGSLVPHKGVHDLLRAFNGMPPEATLDIYGSLHDAPEYVRELRGLAGHSGIRLYGQREPDRVHEILGSLDCLVVPSVWRENASLSIQEALAAGTPVVASDLGGNRELLADGGGLLFEAGDIATLRHTLVRVASEPGLAASLAATIPRVHSLSEHVEDLASLYQRVVGTGEGPETLGGAWSLRPEAPPYE